MTNLKEANEMVDELPTVAECSEQEEHSADDYTEYLRQNEWSYYDRNADLQRFNDSY